MCYVFTVVDEICNICYCIPVKFLDNELCTVVGLLLLPPEQHAVQVCCKPICIFLELHNQLSVPKAKLTLGAFLFVEYIVI